MLSKIKEKVYVINLFSQDFCCFSKYLHIITGMNTET